MPDRAHPTLTLNRRTFYLVGTGLVVAACWVGWAAVTIEAGVFNRVGWLHLVSLGLLDFGSIAYGFVLIYHVWARGRPTPAAPVLPEETVEMYRTSARDVEAWVAAVSEPTRVLPHLNPGDSWRGFGPVAPLRAVAGASPPPRLVITPPDQPPPSKVIPWSPTAARW